MIDGGNEYAQICFHYFQTDFIFFFLSLFPNFMHVLFALLFSSVL